MNLSTYPRMLQIARAFASAGWDQYVARLRLARGDAHGDAMASTGAMNAQRLRETIEKLGPTFVKFGQLLSLRRDILPDAYIDELTKLQDDVASDLTMDVSAVIEAELGTAMDEAFASFAEKPFAAASMAQVYDATLSDGTAVVVKVQRSGIDAMIRTDLGIMAMLARQLERHVAETRRFSPVELVDEFARTILAELDFTREGRNADRFRSNFGDDPAVYVPTIFWELTSPRILTMARSPGHRAAAHDAADLQSAPAFAQTLIRLFLKQVFEHGFFHGDPHPGNVFLLSDGRLCFHDFGIVGELTTEDREKLAELMLGVIARDAPWVAQSYFAMGVAGPEVDRAAFTHDVEDALSAFYSGIGVRTAFSEIMRQFIRLGQRHRIRLPRAFLAVSKAFMEVESQALDLDPHFDVIAALQAYAPQLLQRLLLPPAEGLSLGPHAWRELLAARRALGELPELARGLAGTLREGRLGITVRHEELTGLEDRIDRASNRLSFSLIIASVVVGSAILVSFHAGPHYEGVPLLGLAGFLIAGILGLRWVIAVLRRGKL